MRMRSNKCMPEGVKDLAEKFNIENLEVGKIPAILEGQNIGFNKRDCWNHLRNVRHKNLELGDAQSVIDYLHKKQGENPQFFYRVRVDEHGRAVNFFGYMRDHDETEPTFLWLFSIWLEAMGEQHPLAIITDQDSATAGAIKKVFPNTRHHLCLWHIKKKFPEKLSHIYFKKSKFKDDMKTCIHHTYKVQEFEERWKKMIMEFGLSDNEWLTDLYDIQESWVPVYHRNTFYAGMNTTGRSEGVNAFFKSFVSSKTNLRKFAVRYDQAVKEIVDKEDDEDLISEHTYRIIDERNLILKHGAQIYTRNIYNKY
ncbi:protein FAR1-RELATED SEQUENCE 5-like [Papaver somniferum]|uniref:protein FAR1-RELATED SEQUENCE 5-like n=1 Tax=Papaver somniferum TaxID=3469 RepID=UPI000E6FEF6A|nr:protein FAR1-RELATED SEQUENCE 5-like [Papaver somniferum]